MLDRQHGNIIFICDECQDDLDTGTSNFDAARSALKQHLWISIKDSNGEWTHVCKDCQEGK